MAQIILSGNIVVPSGPTFAFNRTLTVEAYDKIDVEVKGLPAGPPASNLEVGLQPGGAGKVTFIAIVSDFYDEKLTYKINNTATADPRSLDHPQFLAGKGALSLFDGANPPTKLFFSNTSGKDANVQILIGRKAT